MGLGSRFWGFGLFRFQLSGLGFSLPSGRYVEVGNVSAEDGKSGVACSCNRVPGSGLRVSITRAKVDNYRCLGLGFRM